MLMLFIGAVVVGVVLLQDGRAFGGVFFAVAFYAAIMLSLQLWVLSLCILGVLIGLLRKTLFTGPLTQSQRGNGIEFDGD